MDAQLDLIVAGTGQWKANAQLMGSVMETIIKNNIIRKSIIPWSKSIG